MADDLEQMFLGGGDEEEEEEEVTAQSVLRELTEAWRNEKLSPELLPHKSEYVEVMIEQVDQMEENIKSLGSDGPDLRRDLHRLELSRIQYLLRSYLRARLLKIEEHCLWLLKEKASRPELLSAQEGQYLRDYTMNTASVVKTHLDRMPTFINQFNTDQMEVKPELESHVCVRSKVSLNENLVVRDDATDRDDEVELREGSQHILPYALVRQLVLDNKLELI